MDFYSKLNIYLLNKKKYNFGSMSSSGAGQLGDEEEICCFYFY